jgi:outer membrane receptor protein involved in Fe transport
VETRCRYFGPRALIEDNSVRSKPTTLLYATVGYQFNKTWAIQLGVFNLLNSRVNDIEYYYPSRLKNEPRGQTKADTMTAISIPLSREIFG